MLYCCNYQQALSEKIEFKSLEQAVKSDLAHRCTYFSYFIKNEQTIIWRGGGGGGGGDATVLYKLLGTTGFEN